MRQVTKITKGGLMLRRLRGSTYEYVRDENSAWPVSWHPDPRLARIFKSEQNLKAYTTAVIKGVIKAEAVRSTPGRVQSYRDYKYQTGDLDPLANAEVVSTTYNVTIDAHDILMNVDMNELYKKPLFSKKMGGTYSRSQKKLLQKV